MTVSLLAYLLVVDPLTLTTLGAKFCEVSTAEMKGRDHGAWQGQTTPFIVAQPRQETHLWFLPICLTRSKEQFPSNW